MSDGGVILLKSLDERIKLTEKVSAHFEDQRDDGRARHQYLDLFRQRVYGIALGYADCNDAERTRSDPCLKMACDRSPLDSDDDLGSQPMLSRFENSQDGRATVRLQREPESHVIRRLAKRRKKAKLVTIDLDPSCDPTHGQQQGTSFHGFYDTCCYLPQFGFLSTDDEPDQSLFFARLRPGNARCYRGAIPLLRRVVPELRRRFPKARIRVRLGAGFSNPMLLDVLDELRVEYVVGMKGNSVLGRYAGPWMQIARTLTGRSGQTETLFGETQYKSKSWSRDRRAIIKAEVVRRSRDLVNNAG